MLLCERVIWQTPALFKSFWISSPTFGNLRMSRFFFCLFRESTAMFLFLLVVCAILVNGEGTGILQNETPRRENRDDLTNFHLRPSPKVLEHVGQRDVLLSKGDTLSNLPQGMAQNAISRVPCYCTDCCSCKQHIWVHGRSLRAVISRDCYLACSLEKECTYYF